MEMSRRIPDVKLGCSFEKMFLAMVVNNNAEIARLTNAVNEQTLYCCKNREDGLGERLLHRFISALELAVLAGYRLKQIQNCWERALVRVP